MVARPGVDSSVKLRAAKRAGRNARAMLNSPPTLTSHVRQYVAGSASSSGAYGSWNAALLTRTSSRPLNASRTASRAAWTAASDVMSTLCVTTWGSVLPASTAACLS